MGRALEVIKLKVYKVIKCEMTNAGIERQKDRGRKWRSWGMVSDHKKHCDGNGDKDF
jgi:hypothetical protein